jgi:heterodisulfide reductase subunit B
MKLGYFPGCAMHASGREYGESLKAVAAPLGIELAEIDDWSCCGASAAHMTNHLLSVGLAARNLSLAEAQGLAKVVAPCSACFGRLAAARLELGKDASLAKRIRPMLDRPFENAVDVLNILTVLRGALGQIKEKVTRPLTGLKVACYYGCLLVRPPEVAQSDDPEAPTSMEQVVAATGATCVEWNRKLDCCGAGLTMARTGSVVRLGRAILADAKAHGAQAVVVACGMCHSNLDMRQKAMESRGESFGMPILYITELIGLSLQAAPKALGLKRHFVDADELVRLA